VKFGLPHDREPSNKTHDFLGPKGKHELVAMFNYAQFYEDVCESGVTPLCNTNLDIKFRATGLVLVSIHRLACGRQKTTTFRRLDLSPSSGEWGRINLLSWAR
jgi:hypothetical protein